MFVEACIDSLACSSFVLTPQDVEETANKTSSRLPEVSIGTAFKKVKCACSFDCIGRLVDHVDKSTSSCFVPVRKLRTNCSHCAQQLHQLISRQNITSPLTLVVSLMQGVQTLMLLGSLSLVLAYTFITVGMHGAAAGGVLFTSS